MHHKPALPRRHSLDVAISAAALLINGSGIYQSIFGFGSGIGKNMFLTPSGGVNGPTCLADTK